MGLCLEEFISRIIDDGIAEVEGSYPEGSDKRLGAIEGFEACRDKSPLDLEKELYLARSATAMARGSDAYWRTRYFELQVEWVCNCVSVVQQGRGCETIVTPTARAALKVARTIGGDPGVV